jgi:MFS family permease
MIAMFVVARLINRIDNRLIILMGFLMTAFSQWQMSGFSLHMGMAPVILTGVIQGFGLGCTFVPLNIIALSTLPRHILTQGTAIRSLMRNLGGSIGISILVATLAENTQIVHSRLVESLRPDNPLAQAPFLPAPLLWSRCRCSCCCARPAGRRACRLPRLHRQRRTIRGNSWVPPNFAPQVLKKTQQDEPLSHDERPENRRDWRARIGTYVTRMVISA